MRRHCQQEMPARACRKFVPQRQSVEDFVPVTIEKFHTRSCLLFLFTERGCVADQPQRLIPCCGWRLAHSRASCPWRICKPNRSACDKRSCHSNSEFESPPNVVPALNSAVCGRISTSEASVAMPCAITRSVTSAR